IFFLLQIPDVEPRALHELSLCCLSLTLTSELIVAPPSHQICQSAAVMLRMRVKKHWKKISPDHRERLAALCCPIPPPPSVIFKSSVFGLLNEFPLSIIF
uniref:Uncharacterized protein n=1 Tax=Oncorhynchus kisutch TaxID=8019 RepID=A0A8C7HEW5_ONCKI